MMQLDKNGLPLLEQFGEEGFVDCVFQVQHLMQDDVHYHFDLRAAFAGYSVGVRARLRRDVQPGFDGEMNVIQAHFYSDGLEISSLGLETERFIEALAQLYEIELIDGPGAVGERFSVIALHQADTGLEAGAVRLKGSATTVRIRRQAATTKASSMSTCRPVMCTGTRRTWSIAHRCSMHWRGWWAKAWPRRECSRAASPPGGPLEVPRGPHVR